jgi:hypothetical protein
LFGTNLEPEETITSISKRFKLPSKGGSNKGSGKGSSASSMVQNIIQSIKDLLP